MTSNDPAAETVYQFISDPGHKENLSGRVRAACITCRRKKIRCSGNSPCTTCTEKGIACEGLIPRRRPKRSPDLQRNRGPLPVEGDVVSQLTQQSSHTSDPPHAADDGTLDKNPVRPTVDLLRPRTESSNDSGYGSPVRNDATSVTVPIAIDDSQLRGSSLTIYEDPTPVSPTTYPDWSFQGVHDSHNYGIGASAGRTVSTSMTAPTTTHLISAAKVLEKQAMALRQLATERIPHAVEAARRQKIPLPLRSDGFLSSSCPQLYQQNAYDDLSFPWGSQIPAMGFTPSTADCSSYWDINSTSPTTYVSQDMHVNSMAPDLASAASTTFARGLGSNPNPNMYDDNNDSSLTDCQRPLLSNVYRLNGWDGCDQR